MLRLMIAAFAMVFAAAPAMAQQETITVATEGAFPPWNSKDSAGNLVGFEIELIPNLCARMNLTCKIVDQSWSGIIPGLQSGKFDAIVAAMSITEQRKKAVLFTTPYASAGTVLATLKSSKLAGFTSELKVINLSKLDAPSQKVLDALANALAGMTIGVNRSTTNETFANAHLKKSGIEIRSYDGSENVALDFMAGRVDAVVVTRTQLELLKKRSPDVVAIGPIMDGGVLGDGTAAAVRQDNPKLADRFSEAIKAAIADGTISKLSQKWFGFDVTPQ